MNTGKQINAMVVILFLTLIAIGAYTIFDPFRSDEAEDEQLLLAAERGANTFALNCRLCHGDRGQGGSEGGRLAAAAALDTPGLQGIEDGVFTESAFEEAFELVTNTIVCGRVGSPMPAWAEDQGGTLNDEQIRQLAVLITEGEWELAQEHADELDAEATGHATVQEPEGSLAADDTELTVSNAGSLQRGQYIRIRVDEETEERLRILPDQLVVERAVNGTEAEDHVEGTEVFANGAEEAVDFLGEEVEDDDTALVVRDPEAFEVGDVLTLEDEQIEVVGHATGLPTTGQVLAEDIGREPERFMVSDTEGIEAGGAIRVDNELMTVTAVTDDGDPGIELDADVSRGADLVSVSNPLFFREDYVMRVGDERMRVIGPVEVGQLLGETIGVAETTFQVSGTEGLPLDRPVRMGSELLTITEIVEPATVTVERSVDDTSAASHDAGDVIEGVVETVEDEGAEGEEEAEPEYEPTGQTVLEPVGADDEEIVVTGTSGLTLEQTFRIGDELVRVVESRPAQVRVERGVLDTDAEPHSRRAIIFDGNLLEVERGFADSAASGHESGDRVFMQAIEVEREVEGSVLEAHNKNDEIFLGNEINVERGVLETEPAEHANGSPIYNFPLPPADPAFNEESCGQRLEAAEPQPTVEGPTVEVSLTEWAVEPDASSAPQGGVNFDVTNDGGTVHNFRVVSTDLPPDGLPVVEDAVDTAQVSVVASSASIVAGDSETVGVPQLLAGNYVLICNVPTHYEQGMYVGFTVTAPE